MADLIKINPPHHGSLESTVGKLSKYERTICETLHKINQLRQYPLKPEEILEWKDSLVKRFGKDLDLLKLDFVIESMMDDAIDFDKSKGIQNVLNGLKQVVKTDNGYKVKDFTW